jgi:CheY-like chemotaxis protein
MKSRTFEETPVMPATTPLRMLLVENSPHDIELILFELRDSGFRVEPTLVETRDDFHRALKNQSFDVVLSDYRLPGWSGLDAFADLRDAGRDVPFLLVTGTLGEEAAVDCIKQGINDFILKDRLKRLPIALNRAMSEKHCAFQRRAIAVWSSTRFMESHACRATARFSMRTPLCGACSAAPPTSPWKRSIWRATCFAFRSNMRG